jgi:hypothetical protein
MNPRLIPRTTNNKTKQTNKSKKKKFLEAIGWMGEVNANFRGSKGSIFVVWSGARRPEQSLQIFFIKSELLVFKLV